MTKPNVLSRTALATAALTLAPALAQAHPGHDGNGGGFAAGLVHPVNGVDHLVAMVAVGLWAVQLGGRAIWAIPASFVAAMSVGGLLGINGFSLPFAEHGIMASILVLGALIALAARLSLAQSAGIVALFALFHGYAHGMEAPASSSSALYIGGFALATAVLHALGVLTGTVAKSTTESGWIRAAGAAVIACGLLLSFK